MAIPLDIPSIVVGQANEPANILDFLDLDALNLLHVALRRLGSASDSREPKMIHFSDEEQALLEGKLESPLVQARQTQRDALDVHAHRRASEDL